MFACMRCVSIAFLWVDEMFQHFGILDSKEVVRRNDTSVVEGCTRSK